MYALSNGLPVLRLSIAFLLLHLRIPSKQQNWYHEQPDHKPVSRNVEYNSEDRCLLWCGAEGGRIDAGDDKGWVASNTDGLQYLSSRYIDHRDITVREGGKAELPVARDGD